MEQTPALLMRMSIGPSCSATVSSIAATLDASVTSVATALTPSSPATRSDLGASRAAIATRAPASARARVKCHTEAAVPPGDDRNLAVEAEAVEDAHRVSFPRIARTAPGARSRPSAASVHHHHAGGGT